MTARKSVQEIGKTRLSLSVLGWGAASGLIASLAVSALMLLAERVAGLPVGTFYLVLMSAVTQVSEYNVSAIAQGLLLHMIAGAVLGLVLSAPFVASRRAFSILVRFAPGLGLGAGVLIWAALFVPVTFAIVLPLLQDLDEQSMISQQVPAGNIFQVTVAELLSMIDRVMYSALVFNMFYGLVALILTKSFAERFLAKA